MKNTFLVLLALSLVFVSCKKDDDDTPQETNEYQLSYDDEASDAPALDAGVYELGARFPASFTADYTGKKLEEVSFYILTIPSKCELVIFGAGTASAPGPELYSTNLTATINGESWNKHVLDTPIDITGEDIWICVRVEHGSTLGSLGCDLGPANANGDWMISAGAVGWTSLRDFSDNEVDINWNIRGKVSE